LSHDFQADIDAVGEIPAVPRILDVVCRTTGMGFAAVARVTDDRWIACQVLDTIGFGLVPGGELEVQTTICDEIRASGNGVVFNQASADPAWRDHHTPRLYGLESYISMPIMLPNGEFFGTLCAIDPKPAKIDTPEVINMFKLFAELIAFHLDANARLATSEATLLTERTGSELREQFIAVLGHDLRNPLASIDAGARMLSRHPLDDKSAEIVGLMQSTVQRMSKLIDNVLDFARGRLGGGLPVNREPNRPLAPTLEQVLDEIRSAHPDRRIEARIAVTAPVEADHARVAQLFSNLVGNAVTHGAADQPITIEAVTVDGEFALAVGNGGTPIPPAALAQLFQPFYRGKDDGGARGLGLGLFIASEIARAHGGRITVSSDDSQTCFTFRMPL
jgi:signal transduction histidine kinase